MKNQAIWNIRDARGLSTGEKMFLYTVESRGEATASKATLCADMAITHNTFDVYRDSLTEKRLLQVTPRLGSSTIYRVDHGVLSTYLPNPNSGGGDLPDSSKGEYQESGGGDTSSWGAKKNIKKNSKNNIEEEQEQAPDGKPPGRSETSSVEEMNETTPTPVSSNSVKTKTPGASNVLPAPAAGPPGFTELQIQQRMRAIQRNEEQYGISNTQAHLRNVAIKQLEKMAAV